MGLTWDMLAPKVGVILLTMAPEIREVQHPAPLVESRRCKWWNRGTVMIKRDAYFPTPW